MKKLVFLSLVCITALCLMLLVSCNENENTTHTHAFGEWNITKEASCLEDGSRTRACQCGESEIEVIPAAGHKEVVIAETPATCTESGLTEGKRCTVCGETTVNQEGIPALNHSYKYTEETDEDGNVITFVVCQREACGHTSTSTAGLYDDEDNLIASWDDLVNNYGLIRLSMLNGILLENEDLASATTIIIDESITLVYLDWFEECTNISTIVIHDKVTSIGKVNFTKPVYIKNIIVDENNENYKSIDGNLYNKDGTMLVLYAVGKEDKEFTIPDYVTKIDILAFAFCKEIETIVIPSSVTQIGNGSFCSCDSLKNIYFNGSAEEWEETIKNKSKCLPYNALVHYDGNKMFMAYGFAGDFGSSGASGLCQIATIRDNQIYINAHGYDVLYDTITRFESCEFEYGERIYAYIDAHREPEKLDVLDKIKACDEFYVLEGIDQYGSLQKRICCYIDGTFYILTVTSVDEETGTPIINRINYAIFEWEE